MKFSVENLEKSGLFEGKNGVIGCKICVKKGYIDKHMISADIIMGVPSPDDTIMLRHLAFPIDEL